MNITYVTSNKGKIAVAKRYLTPLGITVEGSHLEMEEIQSHLGEEVIRRKAMQAFQALKKPLIVSDHFWNFEALRGFPGAYMKYMNEWLTPQDFLNLMKPYQNRTVYLEEYLFYTDGTNEKLFYEPVKGRVLHEVYGAEKEASRAIVSLREDGMSIAQCIEKGINSVDEYEIWTKISEWLTTMETKR